jgi:hypothetical protein
MRKSNGDDMKKIFLMVMIVSVVGFGQFKQRPSEQPKVSDSFIHPQSASDWFDFFNPNNFQMRHSYSASYMAGGGYGLALQRYTNTMLYQFAPNLDVRVDLSAQNSPYSTFDHRLQSQFNRVSLSRAEINYRPWENTHLRISYREVPLSLYGYDRGYYSGFGGMFSGLGYYED